MFSLLNEYQQTRAMKKKYGHINLANDSVKIWRVSHWGVFVNEINLAYVHTELSTQYDVIGSLILIAEAFVIQRRLGMNA